MHIGIRARVLLATFFALALSSIAAAQTGPDLLVKPWDKGQFFDSESDGLLQAAGHTDNPNQSNDSIRLSQYEAFGRFRLIPDSEATPRLGYDVSYLDVATTDHRLPQHLVDASIGFAQPLAHLPHEFFLAVTGAAGYAGNAPFDDPAAFYPAVNLIVGRVFNEDQALIVALNYDGHRTFLPDCPIPGFAYAARLSPQLTYVLGLPYSSLTYEPVKGFQSEIGYTLVNTFEAKFAYEFVKHFAAFVQYSDSLKPYHLNDTDSLRRLFFQTHDVEAGVRYNLNKLIRFSVSGGWAFGQEFSDGFDSRNLRPVRHLSDAPFARLDLEVGF